MNGTILLVALLLASNMALISGLRRLRRLRDSHDALARVHAEFTRRFAPIVDLDCERRLVLTEIEAQRARLLEASADQARERERLVEELAAARAAAAAELARERQLSAAELASDRAWQDLDLERARVEQERSALALRAQEAQARGELHTLRGEITRLRGELSALDEQSDLHAVGLYVPRHEIADAGLAVIRGQLRDRLRDRSAAVCTAAWTVNGSAAAGQRQIDRTLKLMLRAFNSESDAAIARVRHDNVHTLEARIRRARDAINGLAELHSCTITGPYLELKLAELHHAHAHAQRLQADKDARLRLREHARDERSARLAAEKSVPRRTHRLRHNQVLLRVELTEFGDPGRSDHETAVEHVHAAQRRNSLAPPALTG